MGVSALRSHAKGKKHQARASSSKVRSVDIRHFASHKENSVDCGEPVLPTASATPKTASTIVDLRKNLHTYIAWMPKFAGAYAWSTDTAATTLVLIYVQCSKSCFQIARLRLNLHWEKPRSDIQCFIELPLNSRGS